MAKWPKSLEMLTVVPKPVIVAVLVIEPTHSRAVRSLAATLEKLGEEEAALEQWARYLELAPGAADADQVAQKLNSSGKR